MQQYRRGDRQDLCFDTREGLFSVGPEARAARMALAAGRDVSSAHSALPGLGPGGGMSASIWVILRMAFAMQRPIHL